MEKINNIKEIALEINNKYKEVRHSQKAKGLAFSILSIILPFLVLINLVVSLLPESIFNFIEQNRNYIPENILYTINQFSPPLQSADINTFFILFISGSLIVTIGFQVSFLIELTNDIYGFNKEINFFKNILATIVIFISLFLLFFIVIIFSYFGSMILFVLSILTNGSKFIEVLQNIYFIKNIVYIIAIFIFFSIIYYFAPQKKVTKKSIIPGVIFSTVIMFAGSYIFDWYTYRSQTYDLLYGNYASFYLILLWIYIVANIILISIMINAYIHNRVNKVKE